MIATTRRTLARAAEIRGIGLHEGQETLLTLRPAAAGTGVVFARTDLEGAPRVVAAIGCRQERPRRTAIVAGAAEVHTVEHLLAAVGGLGVTDVLIEIDRVEVPGLDGSSLGFWQAIEAAGTVDLEGRAPRLVLDREVTVEHDGARITARPCPGALRVRYGLDYGGLISQTTVAFTLDAAVVRKELAPARTFCLAQEALMLKAAGLGKGANTQNTLVIAEDGLPIENTLRFPDECARHKALDLFGDLMLLGASLEAEIEAERSGHSLNAALCRELHALLE